MKRVENKIAIVFGGGQTAGEAMGNGRATCVTLAREGAHVVVVDRDLTSAQETVALIHAANGQAECAQADQTNKRCTGERSNRCRHQTSCAH